LGCGTAWLVGQGAVGVSGALTGELGVGQSFTSQQRPDFPVATRGGFEDDTPLVVGGEAATLGFGLDFRLGLVGWVHAETPLSSPVTSSLNL